MGADRSAIDRVARAKRQVSIKADIWKARAEFYKRGQAMPTTLYIGFEDFYNLCREADPWELAITGSASQTFMGMLVIRVERERHINVTGTVYLDE